MSRRHNISESVNSAIINYADAMSLLRIIDETESDRWNNICDRIRQVADTYQEAVEQNVTEDEFEYARSQMAVYTDNFAETLRDDMNRTGDKVRYIDGQVKRVLEDHT